VLSAILSKPLSVTIGFGFLPFYMGDIAKLILAAAGRWPPLPSTSPQGC